MRTSLPTMLVVLLGAIFACPAPAAAMHLSEGILPASWAGLWYVVAAVFVAHGLSTINRRRTTDPSATAMIAMVGAGIFLISCMPVPVPFTGTCSHPCGTGLGALLIGPGPTVVVASIALFLQALFLQHGGFTTLGANTVSMGIVGAFAAYGVFHLLRSARVPLFLAAVIAGTVADWGTYAATSAELSLAIHGNGSFWTMFAAIICAYAVQMPLGIAEGFLTAWAYRFVLTRRPELLGVAAHLEPVAGVES